jgi:hypothetical protein
MSTLSRKRIFRVHSITSSARGPLFILRAGVTNALDGQKNASAQALAS